MNKNIITLEQLIAASLLIFNELNSLDIELIIEEVKKRNIAIKGLPFNELNKYIINENHSYRLIEGINLCNRTNHPKTEEDGKVEQKLKEIAGPIAKQFIATLSIEILVLKKLKLSSRISIDALSPNFNLQEQAFIHDMINRKLLSLYNDNNKDYIEISPIGEKRLFLHTHDEEVEAFKLTLKNQGFDITLLDEYLSNQDFSKSINEILSVDNFNKFFISLNKNALKSNMSKIEYRKLKNHRKTILDSEGTKAMQDLLSVWDHRHSIYICHPNHVLSLKPISEGNREIININWNDIDINKMKRIGDYSSFYSENPQGAFKYVHNRLGHEIMKEINDGRKERAISYLAVIEKYEFDSEFQYLLRGLIRGDYDGYSIALNPEYERTIPKTIWEKSLRFTGNEIPQQFLKKRKK